MKKEFTKEQRELLEELKGEDINSNTSTILKSWAKELKVKNWWNLKKEELVTEIQSLYNEYTAKAEPEKEPQPENQLPELTDLELEIMTAIPEDCFFESGLDSILWTDCFLDSIKMDNKKARGVLASLSKKGLLELYSTKEKMDSTQGAATNSTITLTELGKIWMEKYLAGPKGLEGIEPQEEEKEVADENLITLKEIIAEAGIKGTKARRLLRGSDIQRPFKRWEWHKEEHKDIIQKVRDLLK